MNSHLLTEIHEQPAIIRQLVTDRAPAATVLLWPALSIRWNASPSR